MEKFYKEEFMGRIFQQERIKFKKNFLRVTLTATL